MFIKKKLRILIHDYCGHPFQFDLSKNLARIGYEVVHMYSSNSAGPKTNFHNAKTYGIKVENIFQNKINTKDLLKRFFQEYFYGSKAVNAIRKYKPDIVICSNTPREALQKIQNWTKDHKIPFIFWLQDLRSVGIEKIMKKKYGFLGKIIGKYSYILEKNILKNSNHIIVISDDFIEVLKDFGISKNKMTFIPNWAPLEEFPVFPKKNEFSIKHKIIDKFVVLYSGTLAMKHNPWLIYKCARHFLKNNEIIFIVISEGIGASFLRKKKLKYKLDNLIILPFQPHEDLPKVLSSADILLTILEPSAGVFSVPSKILTGYCSKRASILVVPESNLSARIAKKYNTSILVKPDDYYGLINAIAYLKDNKDAKLKYAENSRNYAEKNFNSDEICKKFDRIISKFL
ncbi:MAG: glycosyltransferase family 4 protein [Candidatus Helarchaeota archaeon]